MIFALAQTIEWCKARNTPVTRAASNSRSSSPLRKGTRKKTKPRTADLYEVWGTVWYLLRAGCQLRSVIGSPLPAQFGRYLDVSQGQ